MAVLKTNNKVVEKWISTEDGFGTTIVLDCGSGEDLENYFELLEYNDFNCGIVVDPTYPLQDGLVKRYF